MDVPAISWSYVSFESVESIDNLKTFYIFEYYIFYLVFEKKFSRKLPSERSSSGSIGNTKTEFLNKGGDISIVYMISIPSRLFKADFINECSSRTRISTAYFLVLDPRMSMLPTCISSLEIRRKISDIQFLAFIQYWFINCIIGNHYRKFSSNKAITRNAFAIPEDDASRTSSKLRSLFW